VSNDRENSRPTPDPTILTTEQLLREVDRVKELMTALVEGLREVTDERFRSVNQLLVTLERQRTELKADLAATRIEQKADTKAAVDAALIAQKEAVKEQTSASERAIAKSEASNTKQTDQLQASFAAAITQVTTTFNDLKTRVERIENLKQGGQDNKTALYAAIGLVATVIVAAVIVVGFVITQSSK
jgi:DNA repair exonuclease SbcCD ATPase subunit